MRSAEVRERGVTLALTQRLLRRERREPSPPNRRVRTRTHAGVAGAVGPPTYL